MRRLHSVMGVVMVRRLHMVGSRKRIISGRESHPTKEAGLSLITLRPMMRAMIATSKDMLKVSWV